MLVGEVMTAPALSIRADAAIDDAIRLLGTAGVTALPVVDEDERVVGILSEADILREPLPRDPRAHLRPSEATEPQDGLVGDVMTVDPLCVTAHADCADVALTLADTGWKSLPVVEGGGQLVGMVSRSDILRSLAVPDEVVAGAVRSAFDAAGHPEWRATVHSGHVTIDPVPAHLTEAALGTAATVPGVRSARMAATDTAVEGRAGPA
jgi:CBS domain-containing protein